MPSSTHITLKGCRQHHLKNFDLEIPIGKITVVTGPSGAGKSSLVFDTIYAEGQRRYVETFSPYVRSFFDRMDRPAIDSIEGIPPTVAIEQKNNIKNSRSSVGTLTEINDYMKLLFSRLAVGKDPKTGETIQPDTAQSIQTWLLDHCLDQNIAITFNAHFSANTSTQEKQEWLRQAGYLRILHDQQLVFLDDIHQTHLPQNIVIVQDRLKIKASSKARLAESIEAAWLHGKGFLEIFYLDYIGKSQAFSNQWSNPKTGFKLQAPTPALFSFNSPIGACPKCRGYGRMIGLDLTKAIPNASLSIAEGAIKPFQGERGDECLQDLIKHCRERGIDIHTPWEELGESIQDWIYYGDNYDSERSKEALEALWQDHQWYGIKGFFDWLETKSYKMHVRVFLSRYRSYTRCDACKGSRLQAQARCFFIHDQNLPQLLNMPVLELEAWFTKLIQSSKTNKNVDPSLDLILNEIQARLSYLTQVGLGYLSLDRSARTLSGGEIQRVNLTSCLGAQLSNTLFILDEPSIGLHSRDTQQLIRILQQLKQQGNTIIVVEHDPAIMKAADHLIDIGPKAGELGGRIMFQGTWADIKKMKAVEATGTLAWLKREEGAQAALANKALGEAKWLHIQSATIHNLKQLNVRLPLQRFVCLSGVSGSGKSTLAYNVIYLHLAQLFSQEVPEEAAHIQSIQGYESLHGIEWIDQSNITRTPRSTPAVYLGAFDYIRQLFCETEEAKSNQCTPGFFSFNSGDGRCDRCSGSGFEKVEMQFLSDVFIQCPDCNGKRYKPSTLNYLFENKSIHDVLDMTTQQAMDHFFITRSHFSKKINTLIEKIRLTLHPLLQVELGYLRLGQALNTLSGGESQRLKLATILQKSLHESLEKRLLILDEPTTGLHFSDVENLIRVFKQLVQAGHSLLVIEHHLDVIKEADWVIEMGPEAGKHGGSIVAEGTPYTIAQANTVTSKFLKPHPTAEHPAVNFKLTAPKNEITLSGARHHNLKNISLRIPKNEMVVISGLSGSGKSTLAFDILFAEGQRRFLDLISPYARQFAEQLEKPELDQLAGLPPTVAIEQRISQGGGKSTVATITELWNFIRLLYTKLGTIYCPDCQVPVEQQSVSMIEQRVMELLQQHSIRIAAPIIRGRKGFHSDIAAWAKKQGYETMVIDKKWIQTDDFKPLARFQAHDIDVCLDSFDPSSNKKRTQPNISSIAKAIHTGLEIGKGLLKVYTSDEDFISFSTSNTCNSCGVGFDALEPRLFSFQSPHGWCLNCRGYGLISKQKTHLDLTRFDSLAQAEIHADLELDRMEQENLIQCPSCKGSRLNNIATNVRIQDHSVQMILNQTIKQATDHFTNLTFQTPNQQHIARDCMPEILQRLHFLNQVGLSYLQLNRSGNTLSGGEAQRIRLAAQLGSQLKGALYVLDEPTIGLHPRDNHRLLTILKQLKDQGNSLIIVEHDEDTIYAADHLIDLGPGAGRLGGAITYQGKPPLLNEVSSFSEHNHSSTYRALSQKLQHPLHGKRRSVPKDHPMLSLKGCSANNLKDLNLSIPLGRLTVLTGVSGAGKSTLLHECLGAAFNPNIPLKKQPFTSISGNEWIHSCYVMDQSPIGKTSRSCPATYVKILDHIRELFAQTPEARLRGFNASRFSFNTEAGRCAECKGNGKIKLEMNFLASTWVSCETCQGLRYNAATLEVRFRDRTIADVLHMTIEEARPFFSAQARIQHALQLLEETGLGYLQLGQASPTLSGGEAQRIKLVTELIRGRSLTQQILTRDNLKKKHLYLIEEPSVGLHLEDVKRLIEVLHRMVNEGHTIVVVEHHMAIAAEADWILDIGPEAAENGGTILAKGTPEHIAKHKTSLTAPFLKKQLE